MSRVPLKLKVSLFALILCMGVVSLGAFTRLVDAGLGCPDWPGCYGHLLWPQTEAEILAAEQLHPDAPVDTSKTWPEMVHRYFAGTLGLVILAIAVISFREKERAVSCKKHALALLVIVTVQALFGMWTVTLKLWPQVVTAHLLGGFTTLMLLWLLNLRLARRHFHWQPIAVAANQLNRLRHLALVALVCVVVQIALGGWTSANYAAMACIDLPTCNGEWLPPMDFQQGFNLLQQVGPNYLGGLMDSDARTAIHVSHRVGAVVVTIVLLTLIVALWSSGQSVMKKVALAIAGLLVVQVTLGILNLILVLPLPNAVAHNGVGALLLLAVVTSNYILHVLVVKQSAPATYGVMEAV